MPANIASGGKGSKFEDHFVGSFPGDRRVDLNNVPTGQLGNHFSRDDTNMIQHMFKMDMLPYRMALYRNPIIAQERLLLIVNSIKHFMKKIHSLALITVFVIFLSSFLGIYSIQNKKSKPDFVPDAKTAVKIAEAIWLPIYGLSIYDCKPFRAKLKSDNVWVVEGTLEEGFLGGTPYIEIQKSDCKILKVTHGK